MLHSLTDTNETRPQIRFPVLMTALRKLNAQKFSLHCNAPHTACPLTYSISILIGSLSGRKKHQISLCDLELPSVSCHKLSESTGHLDLLSEREKRNISTSTSAQRKTARQLAGAMFHICTQKLLCFTDSDAYAALHNSQPAGFHRRCYR